MDYSRELYKFLHEDVKLSREKTSSAVKVVTEKVQQIVSYIHDEDRRFQQQVRSAGSYCQGLKVKAADEFDFNIYLDGFAGFTQWGGGQPDRYYRFNRDYDRTSNISVEMMWQFMMPPMYIMSSGYSAAPMIQHQQVSSSVNVQSPALSITSPRYDPSYDQILAYQRNMQAILPQQRAVQAPVLPRQRAVQAPRPVQGPVQPPGPPVDLENLDTLPDDMELVKSTTPLAPPPKGYLHFGWVPTNWETPNDFVYDGDIIPFYVQRKFKKLLQKALRELPDFRGNITLARKVHGPALTLRIPSQQPTLPEISVDFAVAIPTKLPKPSWLNWPRHGKRWPTRAKIAAIEMSGLNFVAKKPYYWLVSYGEWEKELVKGIDPSGDECRKDCHRVMKRVRERFWCTSPKPVISSYHLKNLLFWECEDNPSSSDWKQDKIWLRFQSLTNRLLECIRKKELLHYFDTRINLLENKDIERLRQEAYNIREFMKNPAKYLAKE